jgi:hypothetical protein
MHTLLRSAPLAALAIILVACGGASPSGSPASSTAPSSQPSAAPSPTPGGGGGIEHATGAADVILRYDEGGGLMGPAFFVSQGPIFTLYGDGTVIFRNPRLESPPAVGDARPNRPYRTTRLSEDEIQSVLIFALGEGGLGAALREYRNDQVADASTAVFTIDAGGLQKTVSVYALGLDVPGMPDALPRAAFARLAARLADFDEGGRIRTDEYAPERYRGYLMDGFAGQNAPTPWPWADLAPSDFVVPNDPAALQLPTRDLTVAQVEALGLEPYRGGFQGLTLQSPDKATVHGLSVRPLLPDDTE